MKKQGNLWSKLWVLPVFLFALATGLFLVSSEAEAVDLEFGPPASFTYNIGDFNEQAICTLNSSHVAIAYMDGSDNYGKVRIGEKSGGSITWGAPSTFNSWETSRIDIECLADNKIIVAYESSDGPSGNAIIGNVSTASDSVTSWGAEFEFKNDSTPFISVTKLSSTRVAISYSYNSTSQWSKVRIAEISGNNISYGAEEDIFASSRSEYNDITALSDTVFVVAYGNKLDSNRGYAVAGSVPAVSGTDITWGTPVEFDLGLDGDSDMSIVDLSSTSFAIGFHDDNNWGHVVVGSADGTDISFPESPVSIAQNNGSSSIVAIDSTHIIVFYRDLDNSDYGTARVGTIYGNDIKFRPSYVFYGANTRVPEATMLDSNNFVTIFNDNVSGTNYGLVGNYSAPTFSLQGISSIVYTGSLVLGISTSNHGINIHIEGPSGNFTEHAGVISGGNYNISNSNPINSGVNTIQFMYSITSSPTQTRIVEYNYDTNTVLSDNPYNSDTYSNFASSIKPTSLDNPVDFYVEKDGTAHVVVNGIDNTFTTDATIYDMPLDVYYDSGTDKVHFVYWDGSNLREGSFDKDGPYSLTTSVVAASLTEGIYGVKIAGVYGGRAIIGYGDRSNYNLNLAYYSGSWGVNAITSDQPAEAVSFDMKLDPDNPTTDVIFFYNDGSDLISSKTAITTGISVPTVIAAGASNDLSPSIASESPSAVEYVYGAEDGAGAGVDTLYSFTEGAGAPIVMDQQGEGGEAIPELPTNIIWKIIIALMAMGAVIGVAAIYRKKGINEAQVMMGAKKPAMKKKAGRPRKTTKK